MTQHEKYEAVNDAAGQLTEQLLELIEQDSPDTTRIAVEIPELDPLDWLQNQSAKTAIYWRSRDERFEVAALGSAHTISGHTETNLESHLAWLERMLASSTSSLRYYGGMRFDLTTPNRHRDDDWRSFRSYRFVLPQVELVRSNGKAELAVNYSPGQMVHLDAAAALLPTIATSGRNRHSIVDVVSRTDTPAKPGWERRVRQALDLFEITELSKIVLARRSDFVLDHDLTPWQVLMRLRQSATGCTLFSFSFDGDTAFLGATPERLYAREGRQIHTEALAGTRPRGEDAACDEDLEVELRTSEKELREHRHVVESVIAGLAPLAKSVTAEEQPTVLKLSSVQHLRTPIEAKLRVKVTDATLLEALHPTAAVNGDPCDLARMHLRELEPFDRGWYAGPVGWISREAAEFAVAIRSGLIRRNQHSLFAGAGIVEGSSPDAEWAELDNKLSAFLQAITGTTGPSEAE